MIKESTSTSDVSFEELQRQHREYESRLEEFSNKSWLTPDEEIEEKRLKKLKLQVKDRLVHLRRSSS